MVRNVLTNEVAALAMYTPQQKKAAKEASETVKRILDMGFTMNHIFIMGYDLIGAIIGQQGRVPLNY